jgi:hypothetical protein
MKFFSYLPRERLEAKNFDFVNNFYSYGKANLNDVIFNHFNQDQSSHSTSKVLDFDGVRETEVFKGLTGRFIHDSHDDHGQSSIVRSSLFGVSFNFGNLLTPVPQNNDADDLDSEPETEPRYISGTSENGIFSDFNVEIKFLGEYQDDIANAFIAAAEYVSKVVTGDLEDVSNGADIIDDVLITARVINIDGEGGILGRAGPASIRSDGGLTATGLMEFDAADAQSAMEDGVFDDIALHEMLHVLGFGTLWDRQDLIETSTLGRGSFVGSDAVAAYQKEFDAQGARGVPLESSGGAGTAGSHWEDSIFDTELMTGFIGKETFISATSIA